MDFGTEIHWIRLIPVLNNHSSYFQAVSSCQRCYASREIQGIITEQPVLGQPRDHARQTVTLPLPGGRNEGKEDYRARSPGALFLFIY